MGHFLDRILLGKKFTSIELFSSEGKDMTAYLEVVRHKDELTVAKNSVSTIEELEPRKTNYPVAIVINNNNVLSKEVTGSEPEDRKLLHKAFPNLDLSDFHYEIWRKGAVSIVSICRKSYVENLLEQFHTFTIISLNLGVPVITNLIMVSGLEKLTTTQQQVDAHAETKIISTMVQNIAIYNINGLQIQSSYTLGFSAILQLLQGGKTTGSIRQYSMELLEKFRQKKFFQSAMKTGLSTMLFLLVVNFLIFNHYYKEVVASEQEIASNKTAIEKLGKLRSTIREKELQLGNLSLEEKQRAAVTINAIVRIMPESVLLSQANLQPLEKKIKEDAEILIEGNTLILNGTAVDNNAFSKWMETIEKMQIVEKLMITHFGQQMGNTADFSVTIKLRNNEAKQKK